jgi:hypothetical protein
MEIQAKDLRIGNWVNCDAEAGTLPYRVDEIYTTTVFCDSEVYLSSAFKYKDVSGIPLTEELLLKMGFVRSSSKSPLWSMGNTMLIWFTEYESDMLDNYFEFRFGITDSYKAHRNVRLDYVHQLQNLTFILTGQELTLS